MKKRTLFKAGIAILASVLSAGMLLGCAREKPDEQATKEAEPAKKAELVRAHAPVIGPSEAPVTIVEFFDPSCEACRAFHPFVKKILGEYPNEVRLVTRYVPFHSGSEAAIGILEAARMQGVYEPVLEAVLAAQPQWHDDVELKAAWEAARGAGLDVEKAREQIKSPKVSENLKADIADAQAFQITRTPTFFVNERPLENFGPEQLYNLVRSEVEQVRASGKQ